MESSSGYRILHVPSSSPSHPTLHSASDAIECYLHVSCYISPFKDPPWLKVQLIKADSKGGQGAQGGLRLGAAAGPVIAELSVHPPAFTEKLPHPSRQFFIRMDCESSGDLAHQLMAQGAISLVTPEVALPLNSGRGRAVAVDLCLGDSDMVVELVVAEERKRLAEDESRFLSNTYIMHLGL
jgi:hypothetical protein